LNFKQSITGILTGSIILIVSCNNNNDDNIHTGILQLINTKVGTFYLDLNENKTDVPVDKNIFIEFSNILDTSTVVPSIKLYKGESDISIPDISFADEFRTIVIKASRNLDYYADYTLKILPDLRGINGETFPGVEYHFTTINGTLAINRITVNGSDFSSTFGRDINFRQLIIEIDFSDSLDPSDYESFFILSGNPGLDISLPEGNKKVIISNTTDLKDYTRYFFTVSSNLKSLHKYNFSGFSNYFYTSLDSTPKFPLISDEQLLNLIQQQTFKYFYDFAHPACGLARERNTSGDVVTIGGSGFGLMALIVGMERNFITREEGLIRLDKILDFLETCDRWHGAWPHWLNGTSGKIEPFSPKDDGADLVETSFMVQGLLTFRQYLNSDVTAENDLINRIQALYDSVEWDWFTRGQEVLYWHWSPNNGWEVNLKIQGYNETLITYVLAASSTTHPVSAGTFHKGYMQNGAIVNGRSYYGITLPLGGDYGGPLFFTHYSFLGLDPRNLSDSYADYWVQNVNHTLINRAYCIANPKKFIGYSEDCWGLTASDNQNGYSAHSPTNDLGVITPTAAISAIAYTPQESLDAIRHFYYLLGDKLWGQYGFYDAFNVTEGWWADSYISIDQGPIILMIENYRTGLLWDLFMSSPEIQAGLTRLGFVY
jgi:hypothetical protein